MEDTKRRNLHRGYIKLETWLLGMDLFAGHSISCITKWKTNVSAMESLENKRGTNQGSDTLPPSKNP